MATFELDPRLAINHFILEWPLCSVFLEDDARYPWLVLVPRRPGLREVFHLHADDHSQFHKEVTTAAHRLAESLNPAKMNVAMLGNMVPQLHAHVIARFATDATWPGSVWGAGARRPYEQAEVTARVQKMKELLGQPPK